MTYPRFLNDLHTDSSAGLIDRGETAEEAAIRELQEETGYQAESILDSSPNIVSDPGLAEQPLPYLENPPL
jgi:8-oxo-dGTP pyrophosphatase MutT (NUDIX family)